MKSVVVAVALLVAGSSAFADNPADPNALTEDEKQAGFESLFNGRDLKGWEPGIGGEWKIEDGALYLVAARGLSYRASVLPQDFELRFEWKETEAHDRHRDQNGRYWFTFWTGAGPKPASVVGKAGTGFAAGGRFICMETDEQILKDKDVRVGWGYGFNTNLGRDATRAVGKWNSARIIHQGAVIQHWVNDQKVGQFVCGKEGIPPGDESMTHWTNVKKRGMFLRLEDDLFESRPTWYRGIKVRALDKNEKLDQTPVVK